MIDPGRGAWRVARGGFLAACCSALALFGHLLGGGTPPALPWLLTSALLAVGFVILADRRRGFGALVLASALAQLAFHVAFTLPGHHHGGDPVIADGRMFLGHLGAAVAMAWLLAGGEGVVWRLVALLHRFVVPHLVMIPVGRPIVTLAGERSEVVPAYAAEVARAHPRRGPPTPR